MQSSYKIIKNGNIVKGDKEEVVTEYILSEDENKKDIKEENAKNFIDSYENLAKNMLEHAREKSDKLLSKAYEDAQNMAKQAYDKAYNKGYKEGKEKGYKDAYEEGYKKNIEKANKEGKIIKNNADNILKDAKKEYINYAKEKEKEIRELIQNISENILKREVKDKDGLNEMIFDALNVVKNSKMFIIKINSNYVEEIKSNINNWKEQLAFKGDIFVIEDNSLDDGKALIERDNGKIEVDINIALEKVKEILFSEE